MPDLNFQITGIEPAWRGLTPLLYFKLQITNSPASERIQGLLLTAQIQLQPAQRAYNNAEREKLVELFGTPERWGQTLRNRLWTHADTSTGQFAGRIETRLAVPCTYDLNIASTKYFYALENGEVSLLFLFSGSVFYETATGTLQVERISWNKECVYRMPVQSWKDIIARHYAGTAWLTLQEDVFERLCAYKRRNALGTWEQTIEQLLDQKQASKGKALTAEHEEVLG
jgi:hypothetical protein